MDDQIQEVRRFNRFFTRHVGALDTNFLETGMSLTEARILFEIRHHPRPCFADDLQAALDLDPGFASRVLSRFEGRGWITRERAERDGRRRSIQLTAAGQAVFTDLDIRQHQAVEVLLDRLAGSDRSRLVSALKTARSILAPDTEQPAFSLRTFRPGDMGMITARQSILYTRQYGFSGAIEINEAEVTCNFLRNFKPGREQCWIAEVDGEMAGSVILTDEGDDVARLRLLYVEPHFQRRGIADALVTACIAFARAAGYGRVILWTHSILEGARRIYARHGFQITETEEHELFGPRLLGETWVLDLRVTNGEPANRDASALSS